MRNFAILFLVAGSLCATAQTSHPRAADHAQLKYVLVFTRHGVRAPSKADAELNQFSAQPWPRWTTAPELLTAHGASQMQIVGGFDRQFYAAKGLFAKTGCDDAARVFIYADSNERTLETGRNLAKGMFAGCDVAVHGRQQGKVDTLFHPTFTEPDKQQAVASVRQRIRQLGGDGMMDSLTIKYKPQLTALDRVLQGCAMETTAPCPAPKVPIDQPLFDVESKIKAGKGEKLLTFKGPLATGSTLAEDMELAYAEGLPLDQVGWGHVDSRALRTLMQLHAAATSAEQRAPFVAQLQAALLLRTIAASLQQAAGGKPVKGALGQPADKMLVLAGHDTNLNNLAGMLHLDWVTDGRENDTPPGGALIFELWQAADGYQVKAYYQAQSLNQIRNLTPLTMANGPERVAVNIPACSGMHMADQASEACTVADFEAAVKAALR